MNARSIFFGGALLLLFATGAHAGGKYQRTKDGRTRVWNNYPQAGDAATWSGNRDAYGYATGSGTLTWYSTERKTLTGSNLATAQYKEGSSYSGTMIHGKLDGMVVNVDANGKTFHGIFIDGRKTSDWAAGPAPSPSSPIALPEESTSPRPEPSVVALEQLRKEIALQTSPEAPAQEPSPAPPAEGPASIPARPSSQSHGATTPIPQSTDVTSSPPVAAATYGAATGSSQPDPLPAAAAKRPSPAVEKSLRSLTGPPSSLTKNSVTEESPMAGVTSTSSSPPPAGSRLTSGEVVALADTEARNHGVALHTYQRLQPEYREADEVWSVSYDQMSANGMSGRHFSVSVEDKTKKTSIDAER